MNDKILLSGELRSALEQLSKEHGSVSLTVYKGARSFAFNFSAGLLRSIDESGAGGAGSTVLTYIIGSSGGAGGIVAATAQPDTSSNREIT